MEIGPAAPKIWRLKKIKMATHGGRDFVSKRRHPTTKKKQTPKQRPSPKYHERTQQRPSLYIYHTKRALIKFV